MWKVLSQKSLWTLEGSSHGTSCQRRIRKKCLCFHHQGGLMMLTGSDPPVAAPPPLNLDNTLGAQPQFQVPTIHATPNDEFIMVLAPPPPTSHWTYPWTWPVLNPWTSMDLYVSYSYSNLDSKSPRTMTTMSPHTLLPNHWTIFIQCYHTCPCLFFPSLPRHSFICWPWLVSVSNALHDLIIRSYPPG